MTPEQASQEVLTAIRHSLQTKIIDLRGRHPDVPGTIQAAFDVDPESVVEEATHLATDITTDIPSLDVSGLLLDKEWREGQLERVKNGQRRLGFIAAHAIEYELIALLEQEVVVPLGRRFTAESLVSGALLLASPNQSRKDTTLYIGPREIANLIQTHPLLPHIRVRRIIIENRTNINAIEQILHNRTAMEQRRRLANGEDVT